MNKEQFIKSVKLKGKINYLKRLEAEMENNPQGKRTIQPSKQDYLKAAGQILSEMTETEFERGEKAGFERGFKAAEEKYGIIH